jgi:hypothetical protein
MNHRVKELAVQAGAGEWGDSVIAATMDIEKFAVLIVRECVDWCDAYATVDGTAQKIAEAIKEHLGVE